jgi:hypothetical protein
MLPLIAMRRLLLAGASALALAGCVSQPQPVTYTPYYLPVWPQQIPQPPVATAPVNVPDEPVIPAPRRRPQQSPDPGPVAQAPPRPPSPPASDGPECVGWWRICHFFF